MECDFSALHPRILATQAGIKLPDDFDPYDIPQGRELGKLAALIVINCGVGKKAIQAATYHSDYSYPVCAKAIEELRQEIVGCVAVKNTVDDIKTRQLTQIRESIKRVEHAGLTDITARYNTLDTKFTEGLDMVNIRVDEILREGIPPM